MNQIKVNVKPISGKIISNIDNADKTKIKLKSKSICPITNSNSKEKKKDKTRNKKGSYNIFKALTKRYFNKKEEEEKKNTKNTNIKNNIFTNNSIKKIKKKSKEKDSFKSSKFLRKQLKPFINSNIEKEKCYKIKDEKEKENENEKEYENEKENENEKEKENGHIKFQNKSNKNLGLRNFKVQTKTKELHKNAYNSNRNITKITLHHGKGLENKNIYLVFEGRQETIINYTNQEMVDDENEYMIECLKVLSKLKMEEQPRCKQKVNFNFSNEEKNKKIALFDLDETLVHCTKEPRGLNGDTVNIKLPTNKIVPVGLNIRSHWKEALDLIKNHYNIVVYTASHQSYADAVLNYLDKENKYFQYRLYRNHCVQCDVDGIKFYVKDLDTLNKYYNLKDIVLIDNSVLSFAYHLNNGIPIVPFIEQKDDTQLLMLAYYLVSIAPFDDLTLENKKHINIEKCLLMAKKLAEEEDKEESTINDNNNNSNDNVIDDKKENSNNNNNENDNNNDNDNINDNKSEPKTIKRYGKFRKTIALKLSNRSLFNKRSEKALKIMEDMKKNIGDIYKVNYNS